MSGPHVLKSPYRVIPVGHLRIFIEDHLKGLNPGFIDSITMEQIVGYAFGSFREGVRENPCTYILHSLTIDYLRLTSLDLEGIVTNFDSYGHVLDRLTACFESICPGFRHYLQMAMNHNDPRDFKILRWVGEESILVATLNEYDPQSC